MKILFEETRPQDISFSDYSVIVEQANAKSPSKIKIRGCYIACDCKNVNGRTYSFDYFEKEVIPEYRRIWVDQKRAYAELNHAQSHVVNPKDACELITSLTPEGKNYIGESVVLNSDSRFGTPGTPNGEILAAILIHGGRIGKSTRGAVDNPENPIIDENNKLVFLCCNRSGSLHNLFYKIDKNFEFIHLIQLFDIIEQLNKIVSMNNF